MKFLFLYNIYPIYLILIIFFFFRKEYKFSFSDVFQISDDTEVLKKMGLVFGLDKGQCTQEDLNQAKSLVPRALQPYITCKFDLFQYYKFALCMFHF